MKLSSYIKCLQIALEEYGDHEVIYASDAEGNSYDLVYYSPTAGRYENREFDTESIEKEHINAICIN